MYVHHIRVLLKWGEGDGNDRCVTWGSILATCLACLARPGGCADAVSSATSSIPVQGLGKRLARLVGDRTRACRGRKLTTSYPLNAINMGSVEHHVWTHSWGCHLRSNLTKSFSNFWQRRILGSHSVPWVSYQSSPAVSPTTWTNMVRV